MRCFLAVDVEESLKGKIAELQQELKGFHAKLAEKKNMHFTLRFLGEIDEKTKDEVSRRANKLAESFRTFEAEIKGMGAFPSPDYIRVVWLGSKDVFGLQKAADDMLADMFGKERSIMPHLTIARIRSTRNKESLKAVIERNSETRIGSMKVAEMKLKKSVLTRNGPVYEDVEVFGLHDL